MMRERNRLLQSTPRRAGPAPVRARPMRLPCRRKRALADGSDMFAPRAPCVMLPVVEMFRKRRRSIRSKRMEVGLSWCRNAAGRLQLRF